MSLQFQYNQFAIFFAGLAVFAALYFLLLRWKKRTTLRIGDAQLVKLLVASFSSARFTLKFVLVCLAFAAGVAAVMNLRKPVANSQVVRKGIDVMVAMDVSKSMLATDLQPNRLERAKQLVNRLMATMPDDRIGLVLFAGRAYMQMPLTTDFGAALMYVSSASPDAVPQQGTVISEALTMSNKAFNPAERRFKAVILISDGEDHDEEAIKTARQLAEQGMMINTVGVGSPEGSYIPDPATGENKKDATGSQVITKLNEEELQQIAASTNGIYVRLQSSDDAVKQLQQHLQQIESKAYGDVTMMNYNSYFMWFAAAMLILLLVENFIPERKKALA